MEIQRIQKGNDSNLEKMVKIREQEKKAISEGWTLDKDYGEMANDLSDYANGEWTTIYQESSDTVKQKMDREIYRDLGLKVD